MTPIHSYPIKNRSLTNLFIVESRDRLFVYIAYLLTCCMSFVSWHIDAASSLFRYFIAGSLLLSFNWIRWDRFKVFLIVFLLISLSARRLLVVWTIMAMVYQILFLKIPIRRIALIGVVIILMELFIQIEWVLLGIIQNKSTFVLKVMRPVYDLGTGNSNRIGSLFLFLTFLLYIVLKDKRRVLFLFVSFLISYIAYFITGSRTAFYGSTILNIMVILYWYGFIKDWMRWLIALVPLICFVGTFYLAANMDSNDTVNEAASGRLYYIVKFTEEYTFREWLIGAPIEESAPLDSTYLEIITKGGIILASFFCIGFFGATVFNFKEIVSYLPFAIALLFSGLTETYFINPNSVSILLWIIVLIPFIKYKPKL